jgi:hypothetical protein
LSITVPRATFTTSAPGRRRSSTARETTGGAARGDDQEVDSTGQLDQLGRGTQFDAVRHAGGLDGGPVGADHGDVEGQQAPGDGPPDRAHPDHAGRRAGERDSAGRAPGARLEAVARVGESTREPEQQGDRVLRDVHRSEPRHVRHGNAATVRGVDVDRLMARTELLDQSDPGGIHLDRRHRRHDRDDDVGRPASGAEALGQSSVVDGLDRDPAVELGREEAHDLLPAVVVREPRLAEYQVQGSGHGIPIRTGRKLDRRQR